MYWLKACARCHGDLHEIRDVGDHYVSCIQCGHVLTAAQETVLRQQTVRAAAPHKIEARPAGVAA